MKKLLAIVLAALMVLSLAACSTGTTDNDKKGVSDDILPRKEITTTVQVPDDFKIGMICLHDENSTYDNNFIQALKSAQKGMGLKDEQVVMKTNVPESDVCYTTAVELAKSGCKVIFADSFGHESYMLRAAKEYPDVQFCHATGTLAHTEKLANYHNAFASIYEGRYLAGIAAGLKLNEMIESGKITADKAVMGYVGAFTYAEVISGLTSFYLGAKSVCPSVTMKVQYTGSWYDVGKEQEAANALISKGCVLISQHADSMGAPGACESKGVPNVSYNGSTFDACPETFIISSAINWAPYMLLISKAVCTKTAIPADWCGGIPEGSVVLTGLNQNAAAKGTKEALDKAIAELKAGTLHVFDVTKDNYITVDGKKLTSYMADVDTDEKFTADTEVIKDGYFAESAEGFRSAPYFNIKIDGIEYLNEQY